MKVKYYCGCEFDSENKSDRTWSKYYWPEYCPRHAQVVHKENCRAVKVDAPEVGVSYDTGNWGGWRATYYSWGGATA